VLLHQHRVAIRTVRNRSKNLSQIAVSFELLNSLHLDFKPMAVCFFTTRRESLHSRPSVDDDSYT